MEHFSFRLQRPDPPNPRALYPKPLPVLGGYEKIQINFAKDILHFCKASYYHWDFCCDENERVDYLYLFRLLFDEKTEMMANSLVKLEVPRILGPGDQLSVSEIKTELPGLKEHIFNCNCQCGRPFAKKRGCGSYLEFVEDVIGNKQSATINGVLVSFHFCCSGTFEDTSEELQAPN